MKLNPSESRRRQALLGAIAMLVGLALPCPAVAADVDPAAAPIRAFYDTLLAVMKQAEQLGVRGRHDKLAPIVRSTFDLPAMTRIAVGPEWTAIPPDQQAALLDNFARMTIATYANRFDGWSGQSFEVDAEVLPAKMRALRAVGVPYSDEDIASAAGAAKGKNEMDATIAYLQGLGLVLRNVR